MLVRELRRHRSYVLEMVEFAAELGLVAIVVFRSLA